MTTTGYFSSLESTPDEEYAAFALLAGRVGGQTLYGDTASGGDLTLFSTFHVTKGKVIIGSSAYDEVNDRLGIGQDTPLQRLHLDSGHIRFDPLAVPVVTSMTATITTDSGVDPRIENAATVYYTVVYELTNGDRTGVSAQVSNAAPTDATHRWITLENIPIGPDPRTAKRIILRTPAGAGPTASPYLCATISDNSTTTFLDKQNSSALTANAYMAFHGDNTAGKFYVGTEIAMLIGAGSTILGIGAGALVSTGGGNVLIGKSAGAALAKTTNCTFVGYEAGKATSGDGASWNTAVGGQALYTNAAGSFCVAVGYQAGYLSDGASNTFIGAGAGKRITTGTNNVYLGMYAGSATTAGTGCVGNIYLGRSAGNYETGSGKLFIDNQAHTNEATQRAIAIIYGVMAATQADQRLYLNARVQVGGPNPIVEPASQLVVNNIGNAIPVADFQHDGTSLFKIDDADKIGFFNVTTVVRQSALTAQLTTVTCTAPGTPDYAIADAVSGGYGFSTADEFQSAVKVIANLQTRLSEAETALKNYGLFQ